LLSTVLRALRERIPPMIDLHCHLLPGVDDGPPDTESALAIAEASARNGIGAAVVTPHVYPGRWNNRLSTLAPRFDAFVAAARDAGIPLRMYLGAEVHLLPDSLALMDADEIPELGMLHGHRVVLLELPDGGIPVGTMRAIDALMRRGVLPMIAHPERNKDVIRAPERLRAFVDAGCLLQLTAASVCGWFGAPAHRTALAILDAGWTTAVATDTHSLRHRPPVLAEARHALAARYGEEAARELTLTSPARIVAGRADALTPVAVAKPSSP
jgi:protein-tyrosine phosphatase